MPRGVYKRAKIREKEARKLKKEFRKKHPKIVATWESRKPPKKVSLAEAKRIKLESLDKGVAEQDTSNEWTVDGVSDTGFRKPRHPWRLYIITVYDNTGHAKVRTSGSTDIAEELLAQERVNSPDAHRIVVSEAKILNSVNYVIESDPF